MAVLVLADEDEDTVFELDKETVTIGRKDDCDIFLKDRQISKLHAKVLKVGNRYRLEDQESRNGTYLNGKKIKRSLLRGGDRITLAETLLVYHENRMQRTSRKINRGGVER
jgi:pSer/pThr/pTyr-binding forkhead associated (FHA) protein